MRTHLCVNYLPLFQYDRSFNVGGMHTSQRRYDVEKGFDVFHMLRIGEFFEDRNHIILLEPKRLLEKDNR